MFAEQQRAHAREKAQKELDDKKYRIWCDLVQSFDKKSVRLLTPYKGDGPSARDVLKRSKASKGPGCKS